MIHIVESMPDWRHTHDTVAEARECENQVAEDEAESRYWQWYEQAAERFWTEGPNGPTPDPREEELQAQDDWLHDLRQGFPV